MPEIAITDDAQWRALRHKHIGGSDIAALFGLSPYTTQFALWHEKAGTVPERDADNQKTQWGKLIEPLIAQELGRTLNWRLERSKTYWSDGKGLGCTLDFDVFDHQWGPGIVETKVVFDYADYKRDWSDDRAPPNYELQAQHQMLVTGRPWCAIQVWIAQTATMAPALIRKPIADVQAEIVKRVEAFWKSIAEKKMPDPTGTEAEWAILKAIWPERAPKKIIESGDPKLVEAAQLWCWSSEQIPGLQREKDARRVQLLFAAQDAELLRIPGYDVSIKQDKRGAVRLDVKVADNGVQLDRAIPTTMAG